MPQRARRQVFGPVRYGSQWFVAAQAPNRVTGGERFRPQHRRGLRNLDACCCGRISGDW